MNLGIRATWSRVSTWPYGLLQVSVSSPVKCKVVVKIREIICIRHEMGYCLWSANIFPWLPALQLIPWHRSLDHLCLSCCQMGKDPWVRLCKMKAVISCGVSSRHATVMRGLVRGSCYDINQMCPCSWFGGLQGSVFLVGSENIVSQLHNAHHSSYFKILCERGHIYQRSCHFQVSGRVLE